jgi:hypothetical protein
MYYRHLVKCGANPGNGCDQYLEWSDHYPSIDTFPLKAGWRL